MSKHTVTIYDIAKELNLSASTVSRALQDHPDIHKDTKRMVVELAKKLDYQPNVIARSLRKQSTSTLGVIVPAMGSPFFSSIISGIEEVAYKAGYHVMVCQSGERYDREVLNTRALIAHRVDGILACISQETKQYDHFEQVWQREIPLVFFDRVCEGMQASKVVIDDFDTASRVVDHLIQSGYRRIAHLAGPEGIEIAERRFKGYRQTLESHGIAYDESLVVRCELGREGGMQGMNEFFARQAQADAVFAVNDPVAIGAFEAIKKKGLRIPHDLALTGFSNDPILTLLEPPITTVNQPGYAIGKKAAQICLKQIENPGNYTLETVVLEAELIIRESTQRQ